MDAVFMGYAGGVASGLNFQGLQFCDHTSIFTFFLPRATEGEEYVIATWHKYAQPLTMYTVDGNHIKLNMFS